MSAHYDDAEVSMSPGVLAVDARGLHASGIGRYLRELVAHWLAEPPFEALRLLGDPTALDAFVAEQGPRGAVHVIPYRGRFFSARSQLEWARHVRRSVADAAATFFPHWDTPAAWFPERAVMTVHDLIPFRVRETTTPLRRALGHVAFRRSVAAASHVLCVSHATAADLAVTCPSARRKITVVPNGVTRLPATGGTTEPPDVPSPFALVVGNQKPHKNVRVAIDAVARARALGHRALTLVVAGRRAGGPRLADTLTTRERAWVVDVGAVGDAALATLYARADALLFPSRYEGFGLPVVEAMAAGTPVVAAAIPAVVEVAGDAALLVPPNDADAMATALDALLRSPQTRRTLIARGRERAATFSWRRAARATGRVLQAAARGERQVDAELIATEVG